MAKLIPMVRAGSLVPHVRWLEARDRPVADFLSAAGIPGDPVSDPERAIPLRAAFAFLRDAARREAAPDLGWRVVCEASVADLGTLGRLVLAQPTPARGLAEASRAMAGFCTHERLTLTARPGGAILHVAFSVGTDAEALHQAQLLTLALVCAVCAAARPSGPLLEKVEIPPHPTAGVRHIPVAVAPEIVPAPSRTLTLGLSDAVLQRPLPRAGRVNGAFHPMEAWHNLRVDADFPQAARTLVEAMLDDGQPCADRLAESAGVSLRTLQRRLAADGTTFTALVDAARRRRALQGIAAGAAPLGELAGMLGYASPSGLTRAVRRWAGQSPRALRRGGA